MSNVVDRQVVAMEFDNRDFEKKTKESMSTLDKLKQKLDFSESTNSLNSLSAATETVTQKFSLLNSIAFTAVQRYTNQLLSTVERIAKSVSIDQLTAGWEKFEQKTISVRTIMRATGKDMEYVNGQLEKLMWFTDETSYSYTEMADSIGKFTANGVELGDALTAMEGIATWAAMAGQNSEAASRAMYNLSQAIGMGKLTVADWKSIEIANMSTRAFKKVVIETGKELGTLIEQDGKLVTTAKKTAVTVNNFRNTLQDGWVTNDVMLKSLAKFGSFADKLKESLDTINEKIVDEDEKLTATDLLGVLTDYSDKLNYAKQMADGLALSDEQLAKAQKRTGLSLEELQNEMAGWNDEAKLAQDAAEELGVAAEDLQPILEELSKEEWALGRNAFLDAQQARTFTDAINATKDAVSSAWMNIYQDILGNADQTTKFFTEVTNRLWDIFAAGPAAAHSILKVWSALEEGGRSDFIDAFWNVMDAIHNIAENIKEAWHEVFPTKEPEKWVNILQDLTTRFKEWSIRIKENTKDMQLLKNIVVALASALKFVKNLLTQVGELFYKIGYHILAPVAVVLFSIVDAFALLVTAITGAETPTEGFAIIFSALGKVIEFVGQGVAVACTGISNAITWLREKFEKYKPDIEKFFNGIVDAVQEFIQNVNTKGFVNALSEAWEKIKAFFKNIPSFIGDVFQKIGKMLKGGMEGLKKLTGNFNIEKLIGLGAIVVFMTLLIKTFASLVRLLNGISKVVSYTKDLIWYVASAVRGKAFDFYANGILKLAAAVGVLAASIYFLSKLDTKSLIKGGLAIGGIVAFLVILIKTIGKVSEKDIKTLLYSAAFLASLSAVLLIMSIALKKVASIDAGDLAKGVVALGSLFAIVVFFGSMLLKNSDRIVVNAQAVQKVLLSLAASMLLFSVSMRLLGSMDLAGIGKGLLGMLGIMGVMTLVILALTHMKELNGTQLMKTAGGMLLFATALLLFVAEIKLISLVIKPKDLEKGCLTILAIGGVFIALNYLAKIMQGQEGSIGRLAGTMLAFSASLLIIVGVIAILKLFDPIDLIAPVACLTVLGTLIAFMSRLLGDSGNFKALAGLSIAIMTLALSLIMLTAVDTAELLGATLALTIIITAFTALSYLSDRTKDANFKSIIAMAGAVLALSVALALLSLIRTKKLLAAAAALDSVILAFSAAFAIIKKFSGEGKTKILDIIIMISTVAALGFVLKSVASSIKPQEALSTGIALSALLVAVSGCITLLNMFAKKGISKKVFKTLAEFVLIVAALGLVLAGLSWITNGDAALPIVASITTFLTALAGIMVVLDKFGGEGISKNVFKTLTELVLIVAALGLVLAGLSWITNTEAVLPIVTSITTLLTALTGVMVILNKFGGTGIDKGIVKSMLQLTGILALVGAVITVMSHLADADTILAVTIAATAGLLGIAVVTAAVAKIGKIKGGAESVKAGAEMIRAMLPTIGLIIAAIAGIGLVAALIDDAFKGKASETIIRGIEILGDIFYAVGQAFGKIVAGIADGLFNIIDSLGTHLSNFYTNVTPFIEGMKSIPSSVMDGAKSLAEAVLCIMAASVLDRVTSWMGLGTSSLEAFGDNIAALGSGLRTFSDEISDLTEDDISKAKLASDIIKALAEVENELKNHGGLWQAITGDSSLGSFARDLGALAPTLTSAADSFSSFDKDAVKGFKRAATMITALAEAEKALKDHGGLWQVITGDSSLLTFAAQLVFVGPELKKLQGELDGLSDDTADKADIAAHIIAALSEVDKGLKNHGGVWQLLTGDSSLMSFAADMCLMMPYFTAFTNLLNQMPNPDMGKVVMVTGCISAFSAISNALPTRGGLLTLFTGFQQTLSDFLLELIATMPTLALFITDVEMLPSNSKRSVRGITNAAKALGALAQIANELPNGFGIFDVFTGSQMTVGEFLGTLMPENGDKTAGELLVDFVQSVAKLKPEDTDIILRSSKCLGALADIADELPDGFGIFDMFTGGDLTIGEFLETLLELHDGKTIGEQLGEYANSVKNLTEDDTKAIETSAKALKAMVEVAGVIGDKDVDEDDLLDFVAGLFDDSDSVGTYISKLAKDISDLPDNATTKSEDFASVITHLGEAADVADDADSDDLADFAADLVTVGEKYKNFFNIIKDVDDITVKTAVDTLTHMVNAISDAEVDQNNIAVFSNSLDTLANNGVDSFVKSFSSALNTQNVNDATSGLTETAKTNLEKQMSKFKETGEKLVSYFCMGITDNLKKVAEAAEKLGKETIRVVNKTLDIASPSKKTLKAGMYTVMGLRNGILKNLKMATGAAQELGDETVGAMLDSLGVHSPSLFGIFGGKNLLQGLIDGIKDKFPSLLGNTESVGSTVIDTIRDFFNFDNGEEAGEDLMDGLADGVDFESAVGKGISSGSKYSGLSEAEVAAYAAKAGMYVRMGIENLTSNAVLKKYTSDKLAAFGMEAGQKVIESLDDSSSIWHKYVDEVRQGNEDMAISYVDGERAFSNYVESLHDKLSEVTKDFKEFNAETAQSPLLDIKGMNSQRKAVRKWVEALKFLKLHGASEELLQHFIDQGVQSSYNTVMQLADSSDAVIEKYTRTFAKRDAAIWKDSTKYAISQLNSEDLASSYVRQTDKALQKALNKQYKRPEEFMKVTRKSLNAVIKEGTKEAVEEFGLTLDKTERTSVRKYIRSLYEMSDAYAEDEKAVKKANKEYKKAEKYHNDLLKNMKRLKEIVVNYKNNGEDALSSDDNSFIKQILKLYGIDDYSGDPSDLLPVLDTLIKESKSDLKSLGDEVSDAYDQVGEHILNTYTTMRNTIVSSVKSFTDPLKESFKSVISVFDEFNDDDKDISIDKLISNMESQVTGYEMWRKNLETIRQSGASEAFMTYLESLGVGGAATVKAFAAATSEQIQNASWMFDNQQKAGWQSITDQMLFSSEQNIKTSEKWANNIQTLSTMFSSDFVDAVREKGVDFADVVEALIHVSPEERQKIQASFDQSNSLPGLIADALILNAAGGQSLFDVGEDAGEDLAEGAETGIEENSEGVSDAATEMTDGVAESLTDASAEGSKVNEATKTLGETIVTTLKTSVNKSSGKSIAKSLVNGLKKGFKSTDGTKVIKPLIEQLTPAVSSFRTSFHNKFKAAGVYAGEGFANGIESTASSIYSACEKIANICIRATVTTLDINSPSKVFQHLGEFTGQGFVNGLSSYDDAVYNVSQRLGNSAFDGLSESLSDIYNTVDSSLSNDLVIRPVIDLSDVTAKSMAIDDLFNDDRSTRLGMSISADVAKLQNEKYSEPTITKADIQQMIDSSAEKYGAAIIEALDGVTFESNLVGEVNSRTLFDTVRQENHVFKRTHGYNGL